MKHEALADAVSFGFLEREPLSTCTKIENRGSTTQENGEDANKEPDFLLKNYENHIKIGQKSEKFDDFHAWKMEKCFLGIGFLFLKKEKGVFLLNFQ